MARDDVGASLGQGGVWAYGLPLLVGALWFVFTWPAQIDRIAFDEVREGMRAYELWLGNTTFEKMWRDSVHPPGVPAVGALFLNVFSPEVAFRALQVLVGFAVVWFVVRIGRATGRGEVGMLGGLLVASSPIWWAYSCSISLDIPLAGVAALAAFATVGARRSFLLAVAAFGLSILTKRQGPTLIGAAMLLALLAQLAMQRRRRTLLLGAAVGLCAVVAYGIDSYVDGGQLLFGITRRLGELLSTSPVLVAVAGGGALGLAVLLWFGDATARRVWLPLLLFTAPLAAAPFVSSHPAPRYFLPALPTISLSLAAVIWLWPGAISRGVRVVVSALLLAGWVGVQAYDLAGYWPRQRGHRDAVHWLAEHVPHTDIIMSPTGMFLQLASVQEGTVTTRILDIDRTTCARTEHYLGLEDHPTWIVLPLYRDFGWPPDVEGHAAAMGLELRALVRRDVTPVREPMLWGDVGEEVETIGPRDGVPVLAILYAARGIDHEALAASEPRVLARMDGVGAVAAWENTGVEVAPADEGIALTFVGDPDAAPPRVRFVQGLELWREEMAVHRDASFVDLPDLAQLRSGLLPLAGTLETTDWHHHRWLELQVRADETTLLDVRVAFSVRDNIFSASLGELPRVDAGDGWIGVRVDLSRWDVEALSKIRWFALSAWHDERWPQAPRIELRQIALMPE